jgi:hypothetical protein
MKTKGRWILIFLSLYLMTGCINLRNKYLEKNVYRVQAQSCMAASNLPETGDGLRVQRFSISPEFETNSFVYRLSPTRFTTDFYNSFLISPARMITEVIQEDLWASPLFSPVPAQTMADIHFQLWGKVLAFHGDIQNIKQPKAIVTIRLILEKNTGDGFTPVINKTYGAQILLDAADPGLLADGLGKGINEILDAFYTDIEKTGLTKK